ncbi:ABC-F family ATP-binding cassette domain-containing protein [Haliovirga abyssi]|uniref:ABC transporter ATP-binding protein n=1 Tax=Haliovirga abyssi TaxID=2996794 RepID=A0AAU9DKC2_9FUSO|nr:ABC-F family ATP-binding cassette domain-containing protein [Haliovirga abyssi]BDU51359.1 ABC transporter ATP-binding protein [Haliovirga abyssi]
MALIQFKDIYKAYSGEYVLEDINFTIDNKDRIGVVGVNGCGKTTLVKMILGLEGDEISPETKSKGNMVYKSNIEIGYLSQNFDLDERNTVFEEIVNVYEDIHDKYKEIETLNSEIAIYTGEKQKEKMDMLAKLSFEYEQAEGYSIEYRIKEILNGIDMPEELWNLEISKLSGGQKSRVALAKILLKEPELLILDEPTNHLDLNAIEWLEKFLKGYKNAFLLISHDRYFLDNVTTSIFEIEDKTLHTYKGNFTDFIIQKDMRIKGELREYEKQQEKIKKTEEFIIRYKAGIKAKQARGREKILNRLKRAKRPITEIDKMKLRFEIERNSGEKVLEAFNISKKYGNKKLFENLNFTIYRGEKIGIIGKNGVGKSTLLKMITELEDENGEFKIGVNVKIGFYDQQHKNLNLNDTILEEIMSDLTITEEKARMIASQFLFEDEDINKKIKDLSGGEKARVSFIKIMREKPNFLILDEPTNHLDIYSKEVLIESLKNYEGTLIVVSHDRYFLESLIEVIYLLDKNGLEKFSGNYEAYKNRGKIKKKVEKKDNSYAEQKKIKSEIKIKENRLKKVERLIEELEGKKDELEKEYEKAGRENSYDKLIELQTQIEELDENILENMEEWEELEEFFKNI